MSTHYQFTHICHIICKALTYALVHTFSTHIAYHLITLYFLFMVCITSFTHCIWSPLAQYTHMFISHTYMLMFIHFHIHYSYALMYIIMLSFFSCAFTYAITFIHIISSHTNAILFTKRILYFYARLKHDHHTFMHFHTVTTCNSS